MNEFIDIPPKKTLAELGLDNFGQSPLTFKGDEENKKASGQREGGVPPNFIQTGEIVHRLTVADGYIQSSNYVAATSGWRLNADGTSDIN